MLWPMNRSLPFCLLISEILSGLSLYVRAVPVQQIISGVLVLAQLAVPGVAFGDLQSEQQEVALDLQ